LLNLDALSSLRVFATQQLRLETLVNLALRNDTVRNFFLAMPAIKSILFLYHLWRIELEHGPRGDNRFDVMICDMPSTGFVVGLYGVPNTLRQIFRAGPLATYALGMESMLFEPDRCGLVVVTLAEEMPVIESIELLQTLRERHGVQAATVVVNAMYPRLIEPDEVKLLKQAFTAEQVNGSMHGVLSAASLLANRAERAERLLPMLRDAFGDRIVELPHLFKRQLPLPAIDELAERLKTQLVTV
jgi:anion-transporting  ArsA/GET3 family ATPase